MFAIFRLFGYDVKWKKVRAGPSCQWVGYWIDLWKYEVGISEGRQRWVTEWLSVVLDGRVVETDFGSGLGRLTFVCGALVCDRPFLSPLYGLAAVTRRQYGSKLNLRMSSAPKAAATL